MQTHNLLQAELFKSYSAIKSYNFDVALKTIEEHSVSQKDVKREKPEFPFHGYH